DEAPAITAKLYNTTRGTSREAQRSSSVLDQLKLSASTLRKEITEGIQRVLEALGKIFVLDPIPSHMRYFSPLAERLANDASNIAGVLAALPEERKSRVEQTLQHYVRDLPEKDIQKVWTEKVGPFQTDAVLLCEEAWRPGAPPTKVDARAMSDGTLHWRCHHFRSRGLLHPDGLSGGDLRTEGAPPNHDTTSTQAAQVIQTLGATLRRPHDSTSHGRSIS
ncbi:MAG: hypothetical protein WCQ21_08540, partial [Verrucomicrobiota bacterium]